MILIITDVDGVLTDGHVFLDSHGNEMKQICYRDLDAIGIGRHADMDFAFATAEATSMVRRLVNRFFITNFEMGAKDKATAVQLLARKTGVPLNKIVYIGDSDRDVPAFGLVGLSVAPANGTKQALFHANIVAEANGGDGVLYEVVTKLLSGEYQLTDRETP